MFGLQYDVILIYYYVLLIIIKTVGVLFSGHVNTISIFYLIATKNYTMRLNIMTFVFEYTFDDDYPNIMNNIRRKPLRKIN